MGFIIDTSRTLTTAAPVHLTLALTLWLPPYLSYYMALSWVFHHMVLFSYVDMNSKGAEIVSFIQTTTVHGVAKSHHDWATKLDWQHFAHPGWNTASTVLADFGHVPAGVGGTVSIHTPHSQVPAKHVTALSVFLGGRSKPNAPVPVLLTVCRTPFCHNDSIIHITVCQWTCDEGPVVAASETLRWTFSLQVSLSVSEAGCLFSLSPLPPSPPNPWMQTDFEPGDRSQVSGTAFQVLTTSSEVGSAAAFSTLSPSLSTGFY